MFADAASEASKKIISATLSAEEIVVHAKPALSAENNAEYQEYEEELRSIVKESGSAGNQKKVLDDLKEDMQVLIMSQNEDNEELLSAKVKLLEELIREIGDNLAKVQGHEAA